MKKIRKILYVLFVFVFVFSLAGCAKGKAGPKGGNVNGKTSDQISYYIKYDITVKNLTKSCNDIRNKMTELDGYLLSSTQDEEISSHIVIRVPSSRLNETLDFLDSIGEINSKDLETGWENGDTNTGSGIVYSTIDMTLHDSDGNRTRFGNDYSNMLKSLGTGIIYIVCYSTPFAVVAVAASLVITKVFLKKEKKDLKEDSKE